MKKLTYSSFDCETTGLNVHLGDTMFMFGIGTLSEDGERVETEIYELDRGPRERARAIQRLREYWADTSIVKIGHNIKFDIKFVQALGVDVPFTSVLHDTMIMSQVLNNLSPSHGLKELTWKLRGIQRTDAEVRRLSRALGGYNKVPRDKMRAYQHDDLEDTFILYLFFKEELEQDPVVYADYLVEIDMILETAYMESCGLRIGRKQANALYLRLEEELEGINRESISRFGQIPNFGSPQEVNWWLYKKLKLPVLKLTATGSPSTDKLVLLDLREQTKHPFLDLVLKYRSYTKGLTMIDGYLRMADGDDVIHPNIKTNEARTGRQSSENPNLQNVSKAVSLLTPFPVPLRSIFTCKPGNVMFLADYAGIELRLIIERAGEKTLTQALIDGVDPHVLLSRLWYGEHVQDPTMRWDSADAARRKILRGSGKNANFALPYGASPAKLSKTLGLSSAEAYVGYSKIQSEFPSYARFTDNAAARVRADGYIRTAFGRRLYVVRSEAYAGANYDIQGTAAGILKRAQIRIGRWQRENWPELRTVIPIHDELIFQYPRKYLQHRKEILSELTTLMTTMPEIRTPLEAEWKLTTTTWADAREHKLG